MIILGLHFGHDAAVAVLVDGELSGYVLRERFNRVKHAIALSDADIHRALDMAGVGMGDVDRVAVTSTQNVELVTGLISGFDLTYETEPHGDEPSPMTDFMDAAGVVPEQLLSQQLKHLFQTGAEEDTHHHRFYAAMFAEVDLFRAGELDAVGCLDDFGSLPEWAPVGLDDIAGRNLRELANDDDVRRLLHCPVTVTLKGRAVPGYFVFHHAAHASASFYSSPHETAAVLTHDGFFSGQGYQSGLYFLGQGNAIRPLAPHHLALGGTYDFVGVHLGLGDIGPAGKLMGLAPYGEPAFFHPDFVDNWVALKARFGEEPADAWLRHCVNGANDRGDDMAALGDPDAITDPVNADIAASTQKLFEETLLKAVQGLHGLCERAGWAADALCLTGGTALNCPANSRVLAESPFDDVFIEPFCDDGGLAVGAALYVHHNVLDVPRRAALDLISPYLGPIYGDAEVETALDGIDGIVSQPGDAAAAAAEDLAADRVIAWFEGGSEAGPRALGHRSILADPRPAANWGRVNQIKSREAWRPFAPAVLEEEAPAWFRGAPPRSPYMLFTADVLSDQLPAITHVDGSARIQTVAPDAGRFRDVVAGFGRLTEVPVVMNTSFNGPGVPIVETPADAAAFFEAADVDCLYIEGRRVARPKAT